MLMELVATARGLIPRSVMMSGAAATEAMSALAQRADELLTTSAHRSQPIKIA